MEPRHAVVTGASSGIGRATALALAREGWRVHPTVRRDEDAAALARAHDHLQPLIADVRDAASLEAAAAAVRARSGGTLHALVNNAGIAMAGPLATLADDDLARQLDVNVVGVLRAVRAFLPLLRAGNGRIVNVSSVAGRVVFPALGAYHASKHALEGLSDALRLETTGTGVRVTVLQPGAVRTPIWSKSAADARARSPSADAAQAGTGSDREEEGRLQYAMAAAARDAEERGVEPEECARAVLRILRARRPPTRVVVGRRARRLLLLRWLLPDRAMDALVLRALRKRR